MIAFQFTATDWGIAAVVLVVLAYLTYRLLKREPLTRIVRLGIFVERQRFDEVSSEQKTEEWKWPKKPDEGP